MTLRIGIVASASETEAFVRLPLGLGPLAPDPSTERALLAHRHPLGASVTVVGLVAWRGDAPVGRIGVTLAPGSDEAFVGFLAASDAPTAAVLFEAATAVAAQAGATRLVGPVDGSFWLRYRLKVAGFGERPYLGEPLNPPTHVGWWEAAGFAETDRYVSTYYRVPVRGSTVPRLAERARRFEAEGYTFVSPRRRDWDATVADLHGLLAELYASFPAYRPVDADAFASLYAPLRLVADLSMMTLARREGRTDAFLIALPDYGPGLASASPLGALATLARHRWRSPRYVLAYLGSRRPGLGTAMVHRFHGEIARRQAEVVGSLIHAGKAPAGYVPGYLRARSEYVLLARDVG